MWLLLLRLLLLLLLLLLLRLPPLLLLPFLWKLFWPLLRLLLWLLLTAFSSICQLWDGFAVCRLVVQGMLPGRPLPRGPGIPPAWSIRRSIFGRLTLGLGGRFCLLNCLCPCAIRLDRASVSTLDWSLC